MVTVTGIVKLTGSAGPDLRLIIDAGTRSRYEITGELTQQITKMQQRRVTVRGWIAADAPYPGIRARLHVVAVDEDS